MSPPVVTQHAKPYAEPERHDELSAGVPAIVQADARGERTVGGKLAKGARKVPSMGGSALKNTTRLSHRIDSPKLPEAYQRRARTLRRMTCAELARTVGGGACGIGPSTIVKFFALATAWAQFHEDQGDGDRAAKRREEARMHLVYSRELVAKDAQARPRAPIDPLAAFMLPPKETP